MEYIFLGISLIINIFLYKRLIKNEKLHKFDIERTNKRIDNAWLKFRTFEKRIRSMENQIGWDDSLEHTVLKE